MGFKGYSSEAIILAKKNYGEADRILVVYSRHFGQLRLIAKGVRRLKSRKRGHLEVFSHIKFAAVKNKGLDIITEAETIDNFADIRGNLKKITVAYFLCEVLSKLTSDGEKNEKIFLISIDFLNKIKTELKLKILRKQFVTDMLINLGFWSNGKTLDNPDKMLEEVTERRVNSIRVGKALLI
jgi:DNA repair protein RecO (recombination protein O)